VSFDQNNNSHFVCQVYTSPTNVRITNLSTVCGWRPLVFNITKIYCQLSLFTENSCMSCCIYWVRKKWWHIFKMLRTQNHGSIWYWLLKTSARRRSLARRSWLRCFQMLTLLFAKIAPPSSSKGKLHARCTSFHHFYRTANTQSMCTRLLSVCCVG